MKTISIFIIWLFYYSLAVGQTDYSRGFQNGYKEGYCYNDFGCLSPLPPLTPIAHIGESNDSYQDGYNRGFKMGLTDKEAKKNRNNVYQGSQNSNFQFQSSSTSVSYFLFLLTATIALSEINREKEIERQKPIATKANKYFTKGVNYFNSKNYDDALKSFQEVLKLVPSDTLSILNAAYSSEKAGNYSKAKQYYNQIIDMNYSDPKIYLLLSKIYKSERDTAKALEIVQAGRKHFPEDSPLVIEELNFYLFSGKSKEALEPLNIAITKNDKNANLYFTRGSIYDKFGDNDKAKSDYQKAIDLNPDYFDANYNMGAIYFNQAADLANSANKIPSQNQNEFNNANNKATAKFKLAQPYLEKAFSLNPSDISTMQSLKLLYARVGDLQKAQEMKANLDRLKLGK